MAVKKEKNDEKPSKGSFFRPGALDALEEPADAPARDDALAGMNLVALLELRARIDERLPARSLADLDLEEELLLQFARTKQLYDAVIEDDLTPVNQRAQVANSCSAILDQLIKIQAKLYSAERIKALEQALIRTMRLQSTSVQKKFFDQYERNLEAAQIPARELPK